MTNEKRDESRKWIENAAEVLAFARVLHIAGYFETDVDSVQLVLSYFEKPWKWTTERTKYEAWKAEHPHDDTSDLPEGFFDGDDA